MTPLLATIGVWFVTFLWGSWFQCVKHIKNVPVHLFITLMYAISVGIVWIVIGMFNYQFITNGIVNEIGSNVTLSVIIVLCGCVFGVAMQMHLQIVKRIGLILSTSVSATCAILGGLIISIWFAGVPQGVSIPLLWIASILLVCATICCQYAGVRRNIEQRDVRLQAQIHIQDRDDMKANILQIDKNEIENNRYQDIVLLAFVNLVLMSSYPLANALGLRTVLNPNAFSSMTCMGLLVIGAFIGSFAITCIEYHKHKIILKNLNISYRLLFSLASIAAFAHFGGNIIHALCAPIISVTIATALGNSYHLWSYVWGLLYGEFKEASFKTYVILGTGVLMFMAGVYILSMNTA